MEVNGIVRTFVEGADVLGDLQNIAIDAANSRWSRLGQDFGALSSWVSGTGCHRFTCRLLEGMLEEADKVLVNFEPCVAELKKTETYFHDGVVAWSTGQQSVAMRSFGAGLSELASDVDKCGVKDQINF